jgi:hypothetical protein
LPDSLFRNHMMPFYHTPSGRKRQWGSSLLYITADSAVIRTWSE